MGAAMSRLVDAISWSGRDVILSLFMAFPSGATLNVLAPAAITEARSIRQYDLEDPDHHLSGHSCREYDLIYDDVPPDIESIIGSWIVAAIAAGADFAWFGFEGSFDLEHILTGDVADQLFAVGTKEGIELALEDEQREGPGWTSFITSTRDRLGLTNSPSSYGEAHHEREHRGHDQQTRG
jgi:hypothetical protein